VKRVLVADDSETILLLLEQRLRMAGYEVVTAADGVEALEALEAGPGPDVILLDAMMPRKSGLDALREIRASGDETPVLIVSAHRGSDEMREAEGMGANGTLTKPIDWDELLGRIEKLAA
jgi:two-component system, OmpR family, response regulator MprA